MAEAITIIGLLASIAQLIDVTIKVVQYANDIKDAPTERTKLALEASNLLSISMSLRYDLEQSQGKTDDWYAAVRALAVPNGPLIQFTQEMDTLQEKLVPRKGVKQVGHALLWPLEKQKCIALIERIERIKTMITLAYERDTFALSLAIKADVDTVNGRVEEVTKLLEDMRLNTKKHEMNEFLSWLSPLSYGSKQSDTLQRHQEGTGRWLIDSQDFLAWQTSSGKILWCPGMPGAGKTTLSSFIISEFERTLPIQPGTALAYALLNYKNVNESAINVVGSFLQQLLRQKDILPPALQEAYVTHHKKGTRPKFEDMLKYLLDVIPYFSDVYFIIDALDEYDEGDSARDILGNALLKISSLQNTHVLVTSRWILNIESLFDDCTRLEIKATNDDISRYLRKRIESSSRLRSRIKGDDILKNLIISTLVERSQGMFLLAQLHLDSLITKTSVKAIRDALATIPKKLDETYDLVMARINEQNEDDAELAKRLLSWLTYSARPMTVRELQHALAVNVETYSVDEESLTDQEMMLSVCAGIVTVEESSNIIRFIHYTTQEYIERIRETQFPSAQHDMTLSCLGYLRGQELSIGACAIFGDWIERTDMFPFLRYAGRYCLAHVQGDVEISAEEGILAFLLNDPASGTAAQVMNLTESRMDRETSSTEKRLSVRVQKGIHLAAYFGLAHTLSKIIASGVDSETADGVGQTALHIALAENHRSCLEVLLAEKRTPEADLIRKWQMLHLVATSSKMDFAQEAMTGVVGENIILDPIAEVCDGRTVLHRAIETKDVRMVKYLLACGFPPHLQDSKGCTPLHEAAEQQHVRLLQLLLQYNPDLSVVDNRGQTFLHYLVDQGQTVGIMEELWIPLLPVFLSLGADINALDYLGRTPLYVAALSNMHNKTLANFLIEHGARLEFEHDSPLLQSSDIANIVPVSVVYKDGQPYQVKPDEDRLKEFDDFAAELKERTEQNADCLDLKEVFTINVEMEDREDMNHDFSRGIYSCVHQYQRKLLWQLKDAWFSRDYGAVFGPVVSMNETCDGGGAYRLKAQAEQMMAVYERANYDPLSFEAEGGFVKRFEEEIDMFDAELEQVRLAGEDMYFANALLAAAAARGVKLEPRPSC